MVESVGNHLPAFTCLGDRIDLWPDSPGLTYAEQNAEGHERAEQLLQLMRRTDGPAILGHVVEAIMERGNYSGVEVGFFHVLAITLMQQPVTEFVGAGRESGFPVVHQLGCLRVVG
jgi:hypothetical protein